MSGTSYSSAYSSRQSLQPLLPLSLSLTFSVFYQRFPACGCTRVSPFSSPPDRIVPFASPSGSTATLPAVHHSISNFTLAIRAIPRSFSTGSHTFGVPSSFPLFSPNPFPFSPHLSSSFFARNPHSSSLEYPRKVAAPRNSPPQESSLAQTSVQIRKAYSASNSRHLLSGSRETRERIEDGEEDIRSQKSRTL